MSEFHDVSGIEVIEPYKLRITFDDGVIREVDMSGHLWGPVFEPLRDPAMFAQVTIDEEGETVCWPTGADLDPIVLYEGLPPLYSVEVKRTAEKARKATSR
jgi:hypothetical protein